MAHDQRWALHLGHDRRDGERLAGAGCAQQDLMPKTLVDAGDEFFNCLRLIAGGLKVRDEFKMGHGLLHYYQI